ncbi:hypothetical protein [Methylocapsa palsarum]|uniref:Uncharacterized protein n=1 Tax=Methylocapsa palsarum TaxID=1612308 RepID=A0A1I3WE16_9HYPH|nr:hypothetical protein [Methylocapsa palsarum]SFK04666.1 hypothetical protein SAMN05444581_101474 [Methylocapsa palsarum]
MYLNRLSWVGLMIVTLGWTMLLSAPRLGELFALWGHPMEAPSRFDMIAQILILSGFGAAILGVLQTGFGALNKFFEAVLARTTQSSGKAGDQPLARQRQIVERGWVKDRAYVLFTDGAVEVETMLGRRHFPSLQEAKEFIA